MQQREILRILQDTVAYCPTRDRPALLRKMEGLQRRLHAGKPIDQAVAALVAELETVVARVRTRRDALPKPTFDDSLPIHAKFEDIAKALREHQVIVLCGETGSGKTTQLPKMCLALGLGAAGLIGHTQPRRIAARAVASRIAVELGTPLGQDVGYKVRFSDRTGPEIAIKVMTDGILLAETQNDRHLDQYEVIIIDEAHERSLNIDFLLGYLKRLLPERPDLKLIITSATLDPERFSRHFGNAPIIEVSGRTYPVEIRYRPLVAIDEDERDRDVQQAILDAVDELWQSGPGDILIFLSGEREIRETAESLRKHHPPNTEILPLYARLSAVEQQKVFQSRGRPRIVLATNVAETSLTVPGIRYVIDPGTARMSRYSPRSKIQRLPIEKISQASANQRAGRCGRVSAGICIRLYAEDDFRNRPAFTDPEILRTHLASVILQMAALHLGEADDFPFVEPPDARQINDGFRLLFELQAVDADRRITTLGQQLARLPLDPRLARMVLGAQYESCLAEVLIITSVLALQDPRERPIEKQQAADEKHRRFRDEQSDFTAFINLWQYYHEQSRQLSKNQLRNLCQKEFLSFVRMREWHDLHHELVERVTEMGLRVNTEPATSVNIHRALLTGLLGHIGLKQEEGHYLGARGRLFYLSPGSGLFKKRPQWVVAAELVETTRLYARTTARIDPEWVEPLATHVIKRNYAEPHWEKRVAQVSATEKVTLYGLPIVTRRRVHYGPIDPVLSRELFIRQGLVAGDFHCRAAFFRHNQEILSELAEWEVRSRRDLTADEETLYDFYHTRLPESVYSGQTFETWRKKAERKDPQLLFFDRAAFFSEAKPITSPDLFPDHVDFSGVQLPLTYRFTPGTPDDGVTLTVPLAAVNQVEPQKVDWLVPGMREERMAALIKSLPKGLRRHFVPVPNFVQALREALSPKDGLSLCEAMAVHLRRMTGMTIPLDAWNHDAVPAHLRMRFQILAPDGDLIAEGRDWQALQGQLQGEARATFAALPTPEFDRERLRDWDFGTLPESVHFVRNGVTLRGYPALVAETDGTVALRVVDAAARAEWMMRHGLRRLIRLKLGPSFKVFAQRAPQIQRMVLHYIGLGTHDDLQADMIDAIVERAFLQGQPLPRDKEAFTTLWVQGQARIDAARGEVCEMTDVILATHHEVRRLLPQEVPPLFAETLADIREQYAQLIYPGFVHQTPLEWLPHVPRYVRAIAVRLQKMRQSLEKDRQRMADVRRLWAACTQRLAADKAKDVSDPAVIRFRWLIEELRVSLFAQELKTAVPVSVKRLEEEWARIIRP